MLIGFPRENPACERRVAVTPDSVARLTKLGLAVVVERGAGVEAGWFDESYQTAGAQLVDGDRVWQDADILVKITPPAKDEVSKLRSGQVFFSLVYPARRPELLQDLATRGVRALALDCVPRISRAQKLDVLSSMANIAGYRAVVEAANQFGGFFTGQITAAGKVPPAKVLVIGAGVAGLAAIGAARGLGAMVRAFDTRLEVKDQVRSMGAEFLELNFKEDGTGEGGYAKVMSPEFIKAEMELFARQAKEVDIIITTALVPGTKAPVLITAPMVASMRPGSVIVDMAAEQGGNCELTTPGQVRVVGGVSIIGYTDLAGRLPGTASQMFANNVVNFLNDTVKEGQINLDRNDEVVRGMLVADAGQVMWPPPKKPPTPPVAPSTKPAAAATGATQAKTPAAAPKAHGRRTVLALFGIAALLALGANAPSAFLGHLTVFVLACFIGWQVVWNVNPALHTPLMSVTNAISGIIVIGAMLQLSGGSGGHANTVTILSALAVLVATINIAGGFLVTQRMLKMFRREAR